MRLWMPAEWDPHDRTLIAWPQRIDPWGETIEQARLAFADLASLITNWEPVTVLVDPKSRRSAESLLRQHAPAVLIQEIPLDDSWIRDSGPIFVLKDNGERVATAWNFNAWGQKYETYDLDAKVAQAIAHEMQLPLKQASIVLEGGAISVNGAGTAITTERVLLNANRNPGLDRRDIENELAYLLGVQHVIWLPAGLASDETDGHTDNLAVFIAEGIVAALVCDDPGDENYLVLRENLRILRSATDARGNRLQVIELPLGPPEYQGSSRLNLSCVNMYFVNGACIVPVYGRQQDTETITVLRSALQNRTVVGFDARAIAVGGGSIHCVTQQVPVRRKSAGDK